MNASWFFPRFEAVVCSLSHDIEREHIDRVMPRPAFATTELGIVDSNGNIVTQYGNLNAVGYGTHDPAEGLNALMTPR